MRSYVPAGAGRGRHSDRAPLYDGRSRIIVRPASEAIRTKGQVLVVNGLRIEALTPMTEETPDILWVGVSKNGHVEFSRCVQKGNRA